MFVPQHYIINKKNSIHYLKFLISFLKNSFKIYKTDMIYGYCRVSTQYQDLIPQIETLKQYNTNIFLFQEKVSTSKQQIELQKLLQTIK
jgi:predicted site-specific integrase-resolvase